MMAVAQFVEQHVRRHPRLVLENGSNSLDLVKRQRREIRDRALLHLLAVSIRFAKQDRRRRRAVGHDLDVHGLYPSHLSEDGQKIRPYLHGYTRNRQAGALPPCFSALASHKCSEIGGELQLSAWSGRRPPMGRRMKNVVPPPTSVLKWSSPPCFSTTTAREMESPCPVPRPTSLV